MQQESQISLFTRQEGETSFVSHQEERFPPRGSARPCPQRQGVRSSGRGAVPRGTGSGLCGLRAALEQRRVIGDAEGDPGTASSSPSREPSWGSCCQGS